MDMRGHADRCCSHGNCDGHGHPRRTGTARSESTARAWSKAWAAGVDQERSDMAKYLVTVTRDCTESTRVDVEAKDASAARTAALEETNLHPERFTWVQDECSGSNAEPYLADPDGCVEEQG